MSKEERQEDKHDEKRRNRGFSGNISRKPKGCVVPTCKEDHPPWVCSSFKRLPVPERKDLISKTKRCFRCLALGHQSKDCPNIRQCGIDHCTSDRHSRYLHDANVRHQDDAANRKSTTKEENGSVLPNAPAAGEVKETTHTANRVDNVSLMVIPAYITNGKKKLRVNVMLDPCSTGTYVTESASQELNLRGKVQSLTISGTGGTKVKTESRRVELSVTSIDEMFSTKIQANVLENITGETPAISWSDIKGKWPHLKSIPFANVSRRRQIDVLIGSDHPIFHRVQREVNGPNDDDPIGRLTNLGWVCFGRTLHSSLQRDNRAHVTRTYHTATIPPASFEPTTNDTLKRFWDLESLGIKDDPGLQVFTPDEKAAIDKAKETQQFKDSHYEIGIPWRKGEPKFSDNYSVALSRLESLEKSLLKKEPEIKEAYQNVIDDYIQKGYIRKLSVKKEESQWFLPHFPVVRQDRATTKVRVVFDAAAQHEGKSLNHAILPCPKLQRELFDVLIRFRHAPVALSADISEVFLQVRL